MAAECRGLPLALIVVGLAMAGVKDVKVWECSKNKLTSSTWTTTDLETKVFSILKLSYDQLPNDTHRNCFLYCALYPEDYEIRVTDVIDKWIGEGFMCRDMTKSIQDIRNDGQSVIAKLKLCCLLESIEDDVVLSRSFKMHDMIREMALWLSCDQNKRIKRVLVQEDVITTSRDDVEKQKIVERVSIMNRKVQHVPPVTYPNLVTLLLRHCGIQHLQNLKCMSKLKVLELQCHDTCELGEIGELVLLEYLCLSIDGSKCPKELKNLKNLKVFNLYLSDSNIASIPSGVISSLQQLRVLRVHCNRGVGENSQAEEEFLEEVESLPKIEEINVDMETEKGLTKLLQSDKLQERIYALRLSDLDTIEMPSLLACISKMNHLQQLGLIELSGLKDYSGISDDTCCLSMLQSVCIFDCHSLTHVTWLKHAPLLQLLIVVDCSSVEEVIKEDENEDSSCVFSSLVNLYLGGMPKLQSIHKTALSFPSLKTINWFTAMGLDFLIGSIKNSDQHLKGDFGLGFQIWGKGKRTTEDSGEAKTLPPPDSLLHVTAGYHVSNSFHSVSREKRDREREREREEAREEEVGDGEEAELNLVIGGGIQCMQTDQTFQIRIVQEGVGKFGNLIGLVLVYYPDSIATYVEWSANMMEEDAKRRLNNAELQAKSRWLLLGSMELG
ncbi:probable disease resistance protein At5g63020 [Neltuma alba]|nr:probable disease resistance protein At5g63020 [Prosopis alba]